MSFDIFFQPCRYAAASIDNVDQATVKKREFLPNDPLTADELAAVRRVLTEANASSPDKFGSFVVCCPDGGTMEVLVRDKLESGCMVALRSLTGDIIAFLYEFLRAGNWTMIPAMEDMCAIATSAGTFQRIPEGFPPLVVCESPAELKMLLSGGFEKWKRYRDRFVGQRPKQQDVE